MSEAQSSSGGVYVAYKGNSYLFGGNAPYVEEMYEKYLENPGSVPDNWRGYFDALQHVPAVDGTDARDVPHQPVINAFAERAKQGSGFDGPVFPRLEPAIQHARLIAQPGDTVLLSPGGTSLDEFKNFEERGKFFTERVRK